MTWEHTKTRCIQPGLKTTRLYRGPADATTTLPVEGPSRTSYIPPPTPLQQRRGGASYEKALPPITHAHMRAAPAPLRTDPLQCHRPDSPVGAPLGYACASNGGMRPSGTHAAPSVDAAERVAAASAASLAARRSSILIAKVTRASAASSRSAAARSAAVRSVPVRAADARSVE